MDRFKSSVFESVIPVASAAATQTLKRWAPTSKLWRNSQRRRGSQAWAPWQITPLFSPSNNTLFGIDDLERKGEKLRIIDVLGLTSLLRERRKCKVVLILNDEELSEGDHEAFEKYSEKVIDSSLVFEPTSEEACKIAIKGTTPNDDLLREYSNKLDIANIRILKKLERFVRLIELHLQGFDARITGQAVNSLVLFGWATFAKKTKLLNYVVKERRRSFYGLGDEKITDEQKGFEALLDAYPFGQVDDFDRVLLDGITAGFFDIAQLIHYAKLLDKIMASRRWTQRFKSLGKPTAISSTITATRSAPPSSQRPTPTHRSCQSPISKAQSDF